jgi:hypothetical protein
MRAGKRAEPRLGAPKRGPVREAQVAKRRALERSGAT